MRLDTVCCIAYAFGIDSCLANSIRQISILFDHYVVVIKLQERPSLLFFGFCIQGSYCFPCFLFEIADE